MHQIKNTPDNTALLREYSGKNFEIGDGGESPSQKVISLQSALKKMENLSRTYPADQRYKLRCTCIDTKECFMITSEGEIKKHEC
jgi:hypothetical protein